MPVSSPASFYDIACTDLNGKRLSLREFKDRPMIIVNTASLCGFSAQFEGLEEVWQKNKDKGLVILGVPSNDFGRQEPGDSAQIISLCTLKFGVTFPLLAKTPVKGEDAHPIFKWLAAQGNFWSQPRWNFYKYAITRDGHLHDWFSSWTAPGTGRFQRVVQDIL